MGLGIATSRSKVTFGSSRLRKQAFRSLLALSVISPRGGELRKEASFIAGCGGMVHEEIAFSAPCYEFDRDSACLALKKIEAS